MFLAFVAAAASGNATFYSCTFTGNGTAPKIDEGHVDDADA
jgi:hypothetical protein